MPSAPEVFPISICTVLYAWGRAPKWAITINRNRKGYSFVFLGSPQETHMTSLIRSITKAQKAESDKLLPSHSDIKSESLKKIDAVEKEHKSFQTI